MPWPHYRVPGWAGLQGPRAVPVIGPRRPEACSRLGSFAQLLAMRRTRAAARRQRRDTLWFGYGCTEGAAVGMCVRPPPGLGIVSAADTNIFDNIEASGQVFEPINADSLN